MSSTKSKRKGTSGESEIVARWNKYYGREVARRTASSGSYDVHVQDGEPKHRPIRVLASRPDHGRWLYSLDQEDFLELFGSYEFAKHTPVLIESKRYRRFALHSIWEAKFGNMGRKKLRQQGKQEVAEGY